ncbi:MAG TPA: hypothetical protein VNA16_09835 [Abditibacteriaceae bacterium]|nr:hypothetical protein [Abditibacteriaceae bacterium]
MHDSPAPRAPSPRRQRWPLKWWLAGVAGLAVLAIAWLLRPLNIAAEFGVPTPTLPQPNAYDLYLQAARSIKSEPVDGILDVQAPRDQAQWPARYPRAAKVRWLRENARGFALFQQALRAEYRHPPVRRTDSEGVSPEMVQLRFLARYKAVESHARAESGDAPGAVASALDALELGIDMPHGAPFIEGVGGFAFEAIARQALDSEIAHLNGAQAAQAAARLEKLIARRVSWESMLREEKWAGLFTMRAAFDEAIQEAQEPLLFADPAAPPPTLPLQLRLLGMTGNYLSRRMLNEYVAAMDTLIARAAVPYPEHGPAPAVTSINPGLPHLIEVLHGGRFHHARGLAAARLALTRLALHAYRKDRGRYPAQLSELAPRYLQAVPSDPFAAGPLQYARSGPRYRLWSVGPDGRNDGGRPAENPTAPTPKSRYLIKRDSQGDMVANVNR